MVKSLADILSEIEEKNSILGFYEGGTPDGEDPNDPDTSEDTGPSNDDGYDSDEEYQGQAMLNYEEDYGKAEGEDQEFLKDELRKDLRVSDWKTIPDELIDKRTASKEENQELMDAGEKEGFWGEGVNPLASLIESIVYGITLGAVDLQLDKGDMFGKDFSTGKTQPQNTAQISVPAIGGPLSVMGLAQMALPSYEVDLTGQGRSQFVGLPGDKMNQVAELVNEVKSEVAGYGDAIQNAVLGTGSGTQVAGGNNIQAINEHGEVVPSISNDELLNIVADNSSKTGLPHEQGLGLGLGGDGEVPFIPTITNAMVDNAIAPVEDKEAAQIASWNWNPDTWYPSAQGGAINAFNRGGNISSNIFNDPRVRMYLEQFTFGSKPDDITNKNIKNYFTEKELQLLKNIIKRKKGDEGTISYNDYFRVPSEVLEKKRGLTSEEEEIYHKDFEKTTNLRDTLGGFSFKRNPKTGEVTLSDTYDWGKEYGRMGHTGTDDTMGIATSGRNVTGLETIKGLPTRDWRDSLEMLANAYGPREINDNPETQTIVDVLGIRPKPRKISYTYKDKEVEEFSLGGLAGMMMPRQQQSKSLYFNDTPGRGSTRYNPFTGGSPNVPPQFGGQLPPPPPQFPGFLGPFGPQRPPLQPPQRPKLDAETYFHTHEGGKVAYPNFPQPFINKEDSPNPFKGGGFKPPLPPARPAIPFQPYPQAEVDEAIISQMNAVEQQPVPPVSISETTATAMQPEEVQETQTTTIEEAPVPREIDIQMPENITATLDFPEQVTGTANYARGGLTNILRNLAPYAAGYLAGPFGYIPGAIAGAGTQYALAGKKRGGLDAIKGMLAGMSGVGVGRVGEAYASDSTITPVTGSKTSGFQQQFNKGEMGESIFNMPKNYGERLGQQGSGIWEALATGRGDVYKAVGSELIGPASLGAASASITPPSQMPEFTEVEVEQIKTMTPEQRKAYLAQKRMQYANKPSMRTQTFAPPNVDIGFDVTTAAKGGTISPNSQAAIEGGGLGGMGLLGDLLKQVIAQRQSEGLPLPFMPRQNPNEQINIEDQVGIFKEAADGGVMEIDEEMESGSFVLPADVVSNVGDGSSDAGHRRLTQLFGGGDEYALGGGTGILKGPIKGPGGGLDDLIQTGIDGVRVARLSTDEFVVPKDVVRKLGDGSQKAGSEKLYDFMKDVRLKKHGTTEQPKEMHMSGLRKMV